MKYNEKAILMLWKIQHDQRNIQKRLPTDQSFATQQSISVEKAAETKAHYLALVAGGWSPEKGFPRVQVTLPETAPELPAPVPTVVAIEQESGQSTTVETDATAVAPEASVEVASEPLQDSKIETAPASGTGIESPESPKQEIVDDKSVKKRKGEWFHVHSFLNVGTIQVLFSILAVLDVIRHFENYVQYFSRFQGMESSWISAILNAVPVVALPAAVVFSFQSGKKALGSFLIITFIPCVMFSVNVTNSNLEYAMADKVKIENASNSDSIKGAEKVVRLDAERAKLISDVEELKSQSKMVTPKLALPATMEVDGKIISNPEYASAVRMINANDKASKDKDARIAEIDKELLALSDVVDKSVVIVKTDAVDVTMNWAQAIFLDLLGVAAVFIAFFL